MKDTVKIVEKYAKAQGLWASDDIEFTDKLTLDMSTLFQQFLDLKDHKIKFYYQMHQRVLKKF